MCAGPHSAQATSVTLHSQIWAMGPAQAACKQHCCKGCYCMDYHQAACCKCPVLAAACW